MRDLVSAFKQGTQVVNHGVGGSALYALSTARRLFSTLNHRTQLLNFLLNAVIFTHKTRYLISLLKA